MVKKYWVRQYDMNNKETHKFDTQVLKLSEILLLLEDKKIKDEVLEEGLKYVEWTDRDEYDRDECLVSIEQIIGLLDLHSKKLKEKLGDLK